MTAPIVMRIQKGMRVKIPDEMQRELNLQEGDFISLRIEGQEIIITLMEIKPKGGN